MIKILLLLLETFLYFIGIQILLNQLYAKRNHYVFIMMLNVCIRLIMLGISFFTNSIAVPVFIGVTILDIISLRFAFQEFKIKGVLAIYAPFYSIYVIVSFVLTFLVNRYMDANLLIFTGTITGLLLVSLCIIIVKIKPDIVSSIVILPLGVKRICIISIISSAIVTELLLYLNGVKNAFEWNTVPKLLLVTFIIIIGSVFPALIANSIGKTYYNRQAKMFEQQIELQAKHYQELAENNFELRRFKHDYKNMLIGVQELIQEGDPEGAMDLLRKGNGTVSETMFQTFETGNGIVDTILSEKQKKADPVNTVIQFEGAVPTEAIAPTDLCVIFGNTLDNAIEACEKIHTDDQNIIRVSCHSAGSFVFVNISNPVERDIQISHNAIKTSKKDKLDHGFGLYSLKKAIANYQGTMKLACSNNIFSVDLELDMSVRI